MNNFNRLPRFQAVASWVLQLTVAGILLQTLFFKFTGAEESVYIFTAVHAEPWGRVGSGVVELLASILLFVPATVALGAILTLGTMTGAILTHLTVLGIVVKGDGGLLFGLALTAFTGSAIILFIRRAQIPVVSRYLRLA
jgi:putative oxidoreductase